MITLAQGLRKQLEERQLTQQGVAVYVRVSGATLSDIPHGAHLPRLFHQPDPATRHWRRPDWLRRPSLCTGRSI